LDNEWFERVCMSALGHRSSQQQTYDLARLVLQRGIPGDFVECGVYAGASCALMAKALLDHWEDGAVDIPGPHVHLFDSFTGIPAPGPHDVELQANVGGESACSLEEVRANMEAWGIPEELLVYWGGQFALTMPWAIGAAAVVPNLTLRQIALLRLDGDLYDSSRVCLQYLYPLVSPGGYVIVDDFNLSGCRKAVEEYFKDSGPAPIAFRKPA
jgi:O-methyltransferase